MHNEFVGQLQKLELQNEWMSICAGSHKMLCYFMLLRWQRRRRRRRRLTGDVFQLP